MLDYKFDECDVRSGHRCTTRAISLVALDRPFTPVISSPVLPRRLPAVSARRLVSSRGAPPAHRFDGLVSIVEEDDGCALPARARPGANFCAAFAAPTVDWLQTCSVAAFRCCAQSTSSISLLSYPLPLHIAHAPLFYWWAFFTFACNSPLGCGGILAQ